MKLRIALLVPHIFMQDELLKSTVFSPGTIALDLANGLSKLGHDVTIFTPTSIEKSLRSKDMTMSCPNNITADYSLIQKELNSRGYDIHTLMQKHPLTYYTLARQLQAEIIAKAFEMANQDKFDIVHVWINEEDLALNFAKLCNKPIVFTHHDPFNFLTRYRTSMWKYKNLNWISISQSQRNTLSYGQDSILSQCSDFTWIANIYHGCNPLCKKNEISPPDKRKYFAYLGRIVEPKGVHLAIKAALKYQHYVRTVVRAEHCSAPTRSVPSLKIAGKHYSSDKKASYWEKQIKPFIDNKNIEYVGFIKNKKDKKEFLSNAKALIVPSTFDEPFGMIIIEALSCGTPIIGLDNGAIPEVIEDGVNGFIARTVVQTGQSPVPTIDEEKTVDSLVDAMKKIDQINPDDCYKTFINKFTVERMVKEYEKIYESLIIQF
jgi:glycosyltransferase involved in cell wall biosynthesis